VYGGGSEGQKVTAASEEIEFLSGSSSHRVETLETLRGMAAAAVAWFHFTNGGSLLDDGWLKSSGAYGWLGVQVFFVISGFVLPYSLWRGGYRVRRDVGTFILKRLIRLEPPYLATLGIVVALAYASAAIPGFKGTAPNLTWAQLLLHLGYLNAYFGYPSLSPVFWTLAIELQFYVMVAIAYPLVVGTHRVSIVLLMAVAAVAMGVPHDRFVFQYLALFGVGMAAFRFRVGLDSRSRFFVATAALAGVNTLALSPLIAAAGAVAALLVAFVRLPPRGPFAGLGAVSYSLYLLHVPIGGRVVNLGARFADTALAQSLVLAAAVAGSYIAAYGLYRTVERPAQWWSSRLRYGRGSTPPSSSVSPEAA
jgi:peptidoglycan/LPS O-acetylase OafA/YrhL